MSAVAERSPDHVGDRPPLIDANIYAALILQEHRGHAAAHRWLAAQSQIASCPLVELAVLRLLLRPIATGGCGLSASQSRALVAHFRKATRMRIVADDLDSIADALPWRHVIGHNQVNDAYLIGLAQVHGLRVCTFDRGFLSLFTGSDSELVELLAFDPE